MFVIYVYTHKELSGGRIGLESSEPNDGPVEARGAEVFRRKHTEGSRG